MLRTSRGGSDTAVEDAMIGNVTFLRSEDFMFQLTADEFDSLRSQTGTSKGRGGRRYAPFVFTEHGTIMAASVLNTERAVEVSVFVVRAFVKLRELVSTHKELTQKFAELERKVTGHDATVRDLVVAIRHLMEPTPPDRGKFGFAGGRKE